MSFVVFLGCDGSGKSTIIRDLRTAYVSEGIAVLCGHWRPYLRAVQNGGPPVGFDDPHGKRPRSMLGSVVKLGWIGLSWWIGWIFGLRRAARSGVLLFDRYYADLLVDPLRYRYGGPRWLALIWTKFLPSPDLVIFLDAEADELLARKQEVSRENLVESRRRYRELLANLSAGHIVDASKPPDVVTAAVRELIDNCTRSEKEHLRDSPDKAKKNERPHQ